MKKTFLGILLFSSLCVRCSTPPPAWDQAQRIASGIAAPLFPDRDYPVTDFGARGDGTTPSKAAFDRAVTVCSENGGGRIIVPPGDYHMDGPLVFKSNVNVHLEAGARLSFSTDERDYLPEVLVRWEGVEIFNYSPFIYAYHVQNIALTGEGILDGNGKQNFGKWKKWQNPGKEKTRQMGRDGVPVHARVFGEGHWLRPGFFEPFGCSRVLVEGVTFTDSPFWVIHPTFCNDVIVRNVRIESRNANNDGCDPESCRNVLIEGCDFSTGDDAVAIKSGRDNDAWRVGQPAENVVIRNCVFRSEINGVCIGSEIGGGVRNVFVENIRIPVSTNAIYFKSNFDRGGYIENIHIRNVTADTAKNTLIRFEPDYKSERSAHHPTRMNAFRIENVTSNQVGECGIYIAGTEDLPVSDIVLENVIIGQTPLPYVLEYGQGILFNNVRVNRAALDEKPVPVAAIPLGGL